nr:MAG TPA: hypothetical protein [Microviridae sp.]
MLSLHVRESNFILNLFKTILFYCLVLKHLYY